KSRGILTSFSASFRWRETLSCNQATAKSSFDLGRDCCARAHTRGANWSINKSGKKHALLPASCNAYGLLLLLVLLHSVPNVHIFQRKHDHASGRGRRGA